MIKKFRPLFIFFAGVILLISLSIKGDFDGTVLNQTPETRNTNPAGPFENSGSASRYSLVEAIMENKSFAFTFEQAKFSAPDISAYKGRVFSIFNPGVSLIGLPFYAAGKFFGLAQIFTYYSVLLFGVINVFLIYLLARKLGAGRYSSLAAGFIFLFGTNAFVYALTFTQHMSTTTFVLLGILNVLSKRTLGNNVILGLIAGGALMMDLVNLVFMSPLFVYAFIKQFDVKDNKDWIKLSFNPSITAFIIGILPFIMFLGIYNFELSGVYTKVPQMIGNAKIEEGDKNLADIQQNRLVQENVEKIILPFNSRRLLNGMHVLLVSEERSWLYYSPIVLMGLGGFLILYRRKEYQSFAVACLSVVMVNIITYSMFIDPWGGWAYGARYLIPGAGVFSIGLALVVNKYGRNSLFTVLFFLLASYSVYMSVLGANTSSTVPPKIEAEQLETPTPYGATYNFQLVEKGLSSSLFYNLFWTNYISLENYISIYSILLIVVLSVIYSLGYRET
jgi:hypothetical protein